MDESKIREHLQKADQYVEKGEELIELQKQRFREMALNGHLRKE